MSGADDLRQRLLNKFSPSSGFLPVVVCAQKFFLAPLVSVLVLSFGDLTRGKLPFFYAALVLQDYIVLLRFSDFFLPIKG